MTQSKTKKRAVSKPIPWKYLESFYTPEKMHIPEVNFPQKHSKVRRCLYADNKKSEITWTMTNTRAVQLFRGWKFCWAEIYNPFIMDAEHA